MPSPATTAKELQTRLRDAGLRATSARIAVLQKMLQGKGPLSHAQVFGELEEDGFDRATVYRNLVDLADAGLLRRTDLGDHIWRFEPIGDDAPHGGPHAHFVCSDCGTVECLPENTVSVNKDAPGSLTEAEIHLRGICNDCS